MTISDKNNLYDEPVTKETPKKEKESEPKVVAIDNDQILYREIDYAMDIGDSVIYLCGEIGDFASFDFMTRCRTILKTREEGNDNPINVILNSPGGDLYEMFAIIDYIKSLKVKVNVIVRGQAMSAGAMILACATGSRICSKHSTIMLHEASIGQYGKSSDIQASAKQYKKMEDDCLALLAESTKKDIDWWRENTRKDLFLSADEALELGIIDLIG